MTETAAKYEAHRDLSCPFCGSEDSIRSSLYVDEGTELIPADDVGEIPTVHCQKCLAEAPVTVWNNRPDPWRYPPEMPELGVNVLTCTEGGRISIDHVGTTNKFTAEWPCENVDPVVKWMPVPDRA